jgi:peptide/nickel transport system ATP-binding protein
LSENPPFLDHDESGHEFRCWFPVGTPQGREARVTNEAAGRTAAGLSVEVA